MANDPPATPAQTPEQLAALADAQNQYATATTNVGQAQYNTNEITNKSIPILNNMGTALAKQTGLFNVFGNAVLGSQKALSGFSNIDPSSITTFSSHFGDLKSALQESGPVAKAAEAALKDMGRRLEATGFDKFIGASKMAAGAVLDLVESYTKNADAAIMFQGGMMQNAASTGEFGKMMEKAGPDMEKLNVMMMNQIDMMDASGAATNKTRDQMARYYAELRAVPGAMNELVNMSGEGTEKIDMLTAAIRVADGTGQNYTDVVNSLHQSFSDFGVSGEKALKFTTQFSEIANKYGIELKDVRAGLVGATSAFKDMADAGEGAANMQQNISKMMNDYVQRLKDTGMTGKHAIDTVKNMTGAMSQLNVAQKAFLSAQSGGPGGLMGAAKIEQMLRKGDNEGVMNMMMSTMKKMGLGKAVTLEEASHSEAAAATRQKQIMMLQQGPLGKMAQTPEDAGRLLESIRAKEEGRPMGGPGESALDPQSVQKAMATGSVWEEKTHTVVSDISNDVRALRNKLLGTSLDSVQRAFTGAAMPEQGVRTANQRTMQNDLRQNRVNAEVAASNRAQYMKAEMATPGMLTDNRSKMYTKENFDNAIKHAGQLMTAGKSGVDTIVQDMKGSKPPAQTTPNINAETEQRRQMQNSATTAPGKQVGVAASRAPETMSSLDPKNFGQKVMRPGAALASAPRAPASPRGTAPGTEPHAATSAGGAPAAPRGNPNVTVDQPSDSGRFNVKVIVTEDRSDQGRSTFTGPRP